MAVGYTTSRRSLRIFNICPYLYMWKIRLVSKCVHYTWTVSERSPTLWAGEAHISLSCSQQNQWRLWTTRRKVVSAAGLTHHFVAITRCSRGVSPLLGCKLLRRSNASPPVPSQTQGRLRVHLVYFNGCSALGPAMVVVLVFIVKLYIKRRSVD